MHTSRYLFQVCVPRAGFYQRTVCVSAKCKRRTCSRSFARTYYRTRNTINLSNSTRHFCSSSRGDSTGADIVDNVNGDVSNKPNIHHKTVQPHSSVKNWGNKHDLASEDKKGKHGLHSSQDKISFDKITYENIFSDFNKERTRRKLSARSPELARPYKKQEKTSSAAVLIPFCLVNGKPSLLFMMRSMHLKNHRGEISFPGGMQDEGDRDLTHTALRETHEEIGMAARHVDVWAEMWASPSSLSGNWVTPVIGFCGEMDTETLTLNTDEVAAVFTTPISAFCDPAHQRQTQFRLPGTGGYTLPVFTGGEHRIWGLTAIMLHQVLTLVAPDLYHFTLKHRS